LLASFDSVVEHDPLIGPDTLVFFVLECLDVSLDGLYFLATLMQLRVTILDPCTYVETCDSRTIRRRMLCSFGFWADLASCVPFMPLRYFAPQAPVAVRCLKLLRFRRLLPWVLAWQGGTDLVMRPYWRQVLRLVLFIIISGHLMGCFWHLATSPEKHPLLHEAAGGVPWSSPEKADRPLFLYYTYFCRTGLYITLGIIVQGHSVFEDFLLVVLAPIGAFANGFVFSAIVVLVSRSTALETHRIERTEQLKQAISTQALPSSLQLRIFAYHTQQRVQRQTSQCNSLFRGLSSQLWFELKLVLYFSLIMEAAMFKRSHPRVLRRLVLVFEDKLFLPGDYVCRHADEGSEMYFIAKGRCAVFSDSHQLLKVVLKGEYFGEVSLLTGQRRTAYVRADAFCALAALSKSNFDSIMREYPKQLELIMETMSEKRIQWIKRLQHQRGSTEHNPSLAFGFEKGEKAENMPLLGATRNKARSIHAQVGAAGSVANHAQQARLDKRFVPILGRPSLGKREQSKKVAGGEPLEDDEDASVSSSSSSSSPLGADAGNGNERGEPTLNELMESCGQRYLQALEVQDDLCAKLREIISRQQQCHQLSVQLQSDLAEEREEADRSCSMMDYALQEVNDMSKVVHCLVSSKRQREEQERESIFSTMANLMPEEHPMEPVVDRRIYRCATEGDPDHTVL